jgi:ABC-2 type transport system permease protein
MNKILLVIQREYMTRVRKKSFLIMTILGPLLLGGIFVSTFLLDKVDTETKRILVVDETKGFTDKFKSNERIQFINTALSFDSARAECRRENYFGILYIPGTSTSPDILEHAITLYSSSQPGFEVISKIKFTLEKEINTQKYIQTGIDEKKLSAIKTDVEIRTRDLDNKETSNPLTTALGFGGGLLIYLFIFIYGAMVMRGVLEEKTSRIVEVIISSVRPFQLMMGKIIGVALVGLTQFLLWVVLTTVVYAGVSSFMLKGKTDKEKIEAMMKSRPGMNTALMESGLNEDGQGAPQAKLSAIMETIDFPVLIGMFIFYFLGGYLLYSALFAAIGAAVDSETDTQQFMFPVTIPLILAYIVSINVINNPQGNVAFWFSIIPFTSPIVMMVRIPFGVSWPQLLLSSSLLIAGFILTTWIAAKIYRTGILMYGKKISYRELFKWLRYNS